MGRHKDFLLEVDEVLVPLMIEAGAMDKCPIHSHCLISHHDDDAEKRAYAMATNAWKEGAISGEREDVMNEVKHLLDTTPGHCTHCADLYAKD